MPVGQKCAPCATKAVQDWKLEREATRLAEKPKREPEPKAPRRPPGGFDPPEKGRWG